MMKNSLAKSAILIIIISFVQILFSFLRDTMFANFYGATVQSDAYFMANTIPTVLFSVIGVAITTTILPIYIERVNNSSNEGKDRFISNIITIVFFVSLIFSVLGIIFANGVTSFFVPNFSSQAKLLTTQMTKILFPSVIFTSLISLFAIVLNAKRIFVPITIASIIPSVVVTIGILLSSSISIYIVSVFTLLGTLLQALFVYKIVSKHIQYHFILSFKDPDIRKIGVRIIPVVLSMGASEINTIVDKMLGSGLNAGSISAINYAQKLNALFLGVVLMAITTVTYPVFSELVAKKDTLGLNKIVNQAVSISVLLFLPVVLAAFIFKIDIVSFIFGHGAFNKNSVLTTSYVFGFYCVMMIFSALREIISKFYFSIGNTRTPMIFSVIGIVCNIVLNLILIKPMGVGGLALSSTIAAIIISTLLIIFMKVQNKDYNLKDSMYNSFKALFAGAIMVITILLMKKISITHYQIVNAILITFISLIVYVAILIMCRTKIVIDYFLLFLKKLSLHLKAS
jgi:putative peptidoglycan lipid II flippase